MYFKSSPWGRFRWSLSELVKIIAKNCKKLQFSIKIGHSDLREKLYYEYGWASDLPVKYLIIIAFAKIHTTSGHSERSLIISNVVK